MPKRIQSPSSINTYKQCPRKYYYNYVLKIPTKPSIHLVRGTVAHTVLEDFFKNDFKDITEDNYEDMFRNHLQELLVDTWQDNKSRFDELQMQREQLFFYFEETLAMVHRFSEDFSKRIKPLIASGIPIKRAITKLTPICEQKFISPEKSVMGFVDAIEEREDGTYIIDYKTSKTDKMSDAYRLQLGIYALLYYEKYNRMPKKVGIYFLKHGERSIDATEELIKEAEFEIEQIHAATEYTDIEDYPKKTSPLCKWSSGQCDFYEHCFEGKPVSKTLQKKITD